MFKLVPRRSVKVIVSAGAGEEAYRVMRLIAQAFPDEYWNGSVRQGRYGDYTCLLYVRSNNQAEDAKTANT